MAVNTKAIGLLFEVAGGGSISGETGKKINDQLRSIVKAINDADTLKLQFQLDDSKFNADLERIKKELQSLSSTSISIGTHSGRGSGSGGTGGKGGSSAHTAEWKNATEALRNYYRLRTQLEQAMTRTGSITPQLGADGKETGQYSTTSARWFDLVKQVNNARVALEEYKVSGDGAKLSAQELAALIERESQATAKLDLDTQNFTANAQGAWSNLTAKVHDYINRVEYSASRNAEAKHKIDEFRKAANSTDWRGWDALKAELREVGHFINKNNLATETWFQKMKKTFGTRVRSLLAGLSLAKITQSIRDIYKYVVDIDTAMTNLKIVTNENDAALKRYAETAKEAAVKIGASVADIIKSTTTYARLGFSLEEAGQLGALTTAYSKVGDVSVDDATKNITGIVKAYQVSSNELDGVIDKLIYVGRRFAISSAEIGEGMNNAASSLAANGNSLNQAMGILTAANTTVQDISRASTATRTIAARLSASKQELEELGETVKADTVVKLEKAFKAYGIEIKNGNGQLKSTYQILGLIAAKWKDLNSDERSAIAGLAAGTRQQDIFYSIIQNWNDAKRVVAEATYASGELSKATEERINSIQGKIDQLKAKLESLSTSVLSSDWVKTLVGALGGLVESLNSFLSLGDGLVGTILLMTTAVVLLQGAYGKLAMSLKNVIFRGQEYIATQAGMTTAQAAAIPASEALAASTLKFVSTGLLGIITVIPRAIIALGLWIKSHIAAKAATDAGTASAITFKGALDALNVNPVVLAITALVAACVAAFAALKRFSKARYEAAQSAKEETEALRDKTNKLKEEISLVDELAERYEELSSAGEKDADKRKEIRDIQRQINKLTNGQVNDFDLVNGKLDEQLKKYKELKAIKAEESANRAADALFAAEYAASIASESNSMGGGYKYENLDHFDKNGIRLLNTVVSEATGGKISGMADEYGFSSILFKGLSGAKEYVDAIEKARDALETVSDYDFVHSEIYQTLGDLLSKYREYLDAIDDTKDELISLTVEAVGYRKQFNGVQVETIDDYNRLRNELIRLTGQNGKVITAMKDGLVVQQDINDAVDDFLAANYGDLYNQHITSISGDTVALKSLEKILDETQTGFDGLTEVMKSVTEERYLTADGLSKLLKLEQDGALAGLELSTILKEDANGYKLAGDALDQYIESLLEEYKVEGKFATEDDQTNAVANLMNFRRVLVMLTKTQKSATDAAKDQQDALKDQLNAYKELIDLRKKLLKQYEDELRYKKDLAEKETRVSQLQSKLAISQLDTSAAGRAKSRELAKELQEAQEDLDDFNLEHAIEVVTNELDAQYEEYEAYINGRLEAIDQSIKGLDLDIDNSKIETWLETIESVLQQIRDKAIVAGEGSGGGNGEGGGSGAGSDIIPQQRKYLTKGEDYSVSGMSKVSLGKDDISVTIDGHKYNAKVSTSKTESPALLEMFGGSIPENGTVAVVGGNAYIVKNGEWRKLVEEDAGKIVAAYKSRLSALSEYRSGIFHSGKSNAAPPNASIYHSGGIVGDTARLKSTELFAKLLKGEFVATPQMMKQFMTSTLPEIASSGMSGGTNEFNAPLISIQCDNVTQESLPGLKEIVDDAVKQIKKQFDDGLGRAGFHKTVKQIV